MREPDQYLKYLLHIENHFKNSLTPVSFQCSGGTYYIPAEILENVTKNNLDTGLRLLTQDVSIMEVGDYYTDCLLFENCDSPVPIVIMSYIFSN